MRVNNLMSFLKFLVIIIIFVSKTSFASDFGKLKDYFPRNNIAVADVMVLSTSPKVQEIELRFKASLSKNAEWFQNYLARAEKGKALIYHENFGISKKEYEYFSKNSRKVQLVKKAEIKLKFTPNAGDTITISGLPGRPPHEQLIYDVKADTINIANTTLDTLTEIDQPDASSPTGRWKGQQWSYQLMKSENDFKSIKFAIGRLQDKPGYIIYYDVKMSVAGLPQKMNYILIYHTE